MAGKLTDAGPPADTGTPIVVSGTTETQPVSILTPSQTVATLVDISQHTDPAQELTIELFVALDGINFVSLGSCKRKGAVGERNLDGTPATQAGIAAFLKQPISNYQAKVRLSVDKNSLSTSTLIKGS